MNNSGYIIIWRVADLAVPYSELDKLARQAGLDPSYLPAPPDPYRAWQKAANLKRQKLIAPADLINDVKFRYGCEPVIQARSESINGTTRHIVRSVIVDKAGSKDHQLDIRPVAVLSFDEALSPADCFQTHYPHDDPMQAVNGNVDALIHRMRLDYERQLNTADGQEIRTTIRKYLADLNAICLAEGTYIVPGGADIAGKLVVLQEFVTGLAAWKRSESPLTCQVYPVASGDSPLDVRTRREIESAVNDHFKDKLRAIAGDIARPDGRGIQATIAKVKRLAGEFAELRQVMGLYAESFDLSALDELVERCRTAVGEAKVVVDG